MGDSGFSSVKRTRCCAQHSRLLSLQRELMLSPALPLSLPLSPYIIYKERLGLNEC